MELEYLYLSNTKVEGNIESLHKLTELKYLYLENTKVEGSIESLHKLTKLWELHLESPKVQGDVEALQNATKLQQLYLSNTKVEGDIESLHKLTDLHHLHLENTNVSGYMASLREANNLLDVKITGSRITGGRCFPHLSLLFCRVPLFAPAPLLEELGLWQAPDARATRSCCGRRCSVWASRKISSAICVTWRVWSGDLVRDSVDSFRPLKCQTGSSEGQLRCR